MDNINASPKTIAPLAGDASASVLHGVSYNPNTPIKTLSPRDM